MNILEELYYGNINIIDKSFDRNSEYASFLNIVVESQDKLNDMLNDEQKELLSQFNYAQTRMCAISEYEKFIKGFKLGSKFMFDTFLSEEEI